MRRKFLCGLAATLWAPTLRAQPVPARDLWEFPLGAVLRPPALSSDPAAGLWNPAAHNLGSGERIRVGVTSLSATSNQGVNGQALGAVWRSGKTGTYGMSLARTTVPDIVRTDFDPQAIGEVPYSSMILSGSATRELLPHMTFGAALRLREGRVDREVRRALSSDFGVVVTDMPVRSARLALSSFLWRPGREIEDRPAILGALDALAYRSGTNEVRFGYSYHAVNRGAREAGPYVMGKADRLEANIAALTSRSFGRRVGRFRSGVGLRYAGYLIGVGREEGVAGLGPLYQFSLSSMIR